MLTLFDLPETDPDAAATPTPARPSPREELDAPPPARPTPSTAQLVQALKDADQDFEWYPTTDRMIAAVLRSMGSDNTDSILDVGAGDGRVLLAFKAKCQNAALYAIEKAPLLRQAQPESITPVGTEFFEQNLMSLEVDVVFSNPPYSEFEEWAVRIIATAHAHSIFLILPQRWKDSPAIAAALTARRATARTIHHDDFINAERKARAVVDVIQISLGQSYGYRQKQDPFDVWFDQNISTFEPPDPVDGDEPPATSDVARLHKLDSVASLVAAYDEEYARMQENYKAIFRLDLALLKELGVNKQAVREGLKKRMAGLKNVYWEALFNHLTPISSRLTTKTKTRFRERITRQTSVAFTESNAYAVALWAIKFANRYFDEQLIDVFRTLSTHDGVTNYKSNTRTWEKDGWRYAWEQFDHYALDYRIVLHHHQAIDSGTWRSYESPGGLHKSCHEVLDDVAAVFGNLGFLVQDVASRSRTWQANEWQDFRNSDDDVVFQAKAFNNGNIHFRFMPKAIKALNIEAGRLLGWLRTRADVVSELGYTKADAEQFGSNLRLLPSSVRLLAAAGVTV